jgi:hypothetical protein
MRERRDRGGEREGGGRKGEGEERGERVYFGTGKGVDQKDRIFICG